MTKNIILLLFQISNKFKVKGNFGVLYKKTAKHVLSFFKILKQHFSNKKNIKLFYKVGVN
jgi:hypothetical protein